MMDALVVAIVAVGIVGGCVLVDMVLHLVWPDGCVCGLCGMPLAEAEKHSLCATCREKLEPPVPVLCVCCRRDGADNTVSWIDGKLCDECYTEEIKFP